MEISITVNGELEKPMGKVYGSLIMEMLMRVNGLMMNVMEKERNNGSGVERYMLVIMF